MLQEDTPEQTSKISLYYRNHINTAYQTDERVLKDIIKRGVRPTEMNTTTDLRIYYKNFKTNSLIMKNNLCAKKRPLDKCNVIYQYSCQIANCQSQASTYIGMCSTSLSRRLTMHLANGSIKNQTRNEHNEALTRDMLVENTTILDSVPERKKLLYLEAIYINMYKPIINVQGGVGTLTLPSLR